MRFGIRAALFALICVFIVSDQVEAQQNLVVRPMRVEAEIPPNRTARVTLTIRNQNEARTEPINLEVVDLTQEEDGTLKIVTDEMRQEMGPDALRASSRDWVSLETDRIEVLPGETAEIPVLLTPPPSARGAYVAAVRLLTDEPEMPDIEADGPQAMFGIRFGFLIPFVTPIAGRPVFQDIAISDVEMSFDEGVDEDGNRIADPTTRAFMRIANEGQTYSSLEGEIVVERRLGANWRTVTRATLPDRKILPGLTLRLPVNLDRRLPSGEYRLLGNLSVDGRRLPRFEKVIDFEGDPEMEAVAYDTMLTMEPPRLDVEGVPGATRANTVAIGNPGDQTLDVRFSVNTPEGLDGVAMGQIAGEDLSAAGWTEVRPNELTLRPGQARNVRVVSRLPREDLDHAMYYADLVLSGRYEDGQSAGETRSRLTVRQSRIEVSPAGILDRMNVSLGEEPARYIVQARFVNTGNVDFSPEVRAALIDRSGNIVKTWQLSGNRERLLPLGIRNFAGQVDVSSVPEGDYTLRIVAGHEEAELAQRQLPVTIEAEDDAEPDELTLKILEE